MTTTERLGIAQSAGRCHVCNGYIRKGEPCAFAPFRHQDHPAWKPGEIEALAVKIGKAAPPIVRSFVTVIDRRECDRRLKSFTELLGRIDAKCDGLQRFNPAHLATTHYQCVRERAACEEQIVHWRTQADLVEA